MSDVDVCPLRSEEFCQYLKPVVHISFWTQCNGPRGVGGKWGVRTTPAKLGVLCCRPRSHFGSFTTTDFHQIWPRHATRESMSLEDFRHEFSKIFHLGVCHKTSKFKGSNRYLTVTSLQDNTAERYRSLHVVVQGPKSFPALLNFTEEPRHFSTTYTISKRRSVKVLQIAHFVFLPSKKCHKLTFRWLAYSPGNMQDIWCLFDIRIPASASLQ